MDSDHLSPRAEVSIKGGSERSVLTTEFWAPLAQQSGRVLYGDLRLMGDNDDNREGNLGFGYRQIVESTDSVIGGHLWIDRRRTEHNSTFHQITIGAESLGKIIDLRANGYVPLNGANTVTTPNLGSTTPYLAGSGIFYDTNGSVSETPQYGIDAEIGYRLQVLKKQFDTIRVYGGGYSFFRNDTDSVNGYRIRTEAVVNSIFSVGARFQHDAPRGDQGFLEATIRFPFSAKKLYQSKGLYGRLDESPERDVDIVTSRKTNSGLAQPFLNASGMQQRILYVDNTVTNGDGSKEHPFNNLSSAQAALQANDILYVAHGDGTTHNMDQGITISQNNISLIGSGSALTIDGYTFLSAGQAPMITNNQARVDTNVGNAIFFTGGGDITVTGINASNAQGNGIYVFLSANNQSNQITITNNTFINNSLADTFGGGINLNNPIGAHVGTLTISNNEVRDTNGGSARNIQIADRGTMDVANINANTIMGHGYGLNFESPGHTGTVNVMNNSNTGTFINVNASGGSAIIDTVTVIGNVTQAVGTPFLLGGYNNARIGTVLIDHNISTTNGGLGYETQLASGAKIGTLTITNNNASNNPNVCCTARGMTIDLNGIGTAIETTLIANNNVNNNGSEGIVIANNNYARLNTVTLDNNNVLGNTTGGVLITSGSNAVINDLEMSNMNVSGTASYGLLAYATGSGTIGKVGLLNIIANNNSSNGVFVNADTNATIGSVFASNIVANNNGSQAIYVQTGSSAKIGDVVIQNSTANNTLGGVGRGIQVSAVGGVNSTINSITLTGNTTNNNAQQGIYTHASSGTISSIVIQGNTANNNVQPGILVQSISIGHIITATLTNNTANGNTGSNARGIQIEANGTAGTSIGLATLTGNVTNNNSQQGIYIWDNNAANLSVVLNHNTSTGNAVNGLYVNKATTGTLIVDAGGGSLGSTGQNRIYSNTGTEVRVDGGYALSARTDYWGGGDLVGGEKTLNGGSTVDSTGFLTVDPGL